ncbi:MAG TPA: hypothetical protein PKY59_17220 [Pyrinomonadaceae bacterium]|nr:hypothetical protein [Pyrinomonadaceae bacterium]
MKHTKTLLIFEKEELTENESALLYLIPLVQTAWSHAAVAPREKKLIFDAAREDGIDERDPFNDLLDLLLTYQPSGEFFETCLSRISENFSRMTKNKRNDLRDRILSRCHSVAASAGTNSAMDTNHHISVEERLYLQRLDEILK